VYARQLNLQGDAMPIGYYFLGVLAALIIIAGLSMLPDLLRYIKISSM
jgi:hypothetical protein